MRATVRIHSLTGILPLLGLMALIGGPPPAVAQGPPGQAIKAENLTKEKFTALPNDQVIELSGKRITKRELLAEVAERNKVALAKAQAAASQSRTKFEAARTKFLQEQKAEVGVENAKIQAEIARLRQASSPAPAQPSKREVIQKEAAQLFSRSKTVKTSAEWTQIEQQAEQLLKQLQQVGR